MTDNTPVNTDALRHPAAARLSAASRRLPARYSLDVMRLICASILFLLSAGYGTSYAAQCTPNEHGVFEELPCASQAFAAADRELKSVYGKLLASLPAGERAALIKSQRAWLAFLSANTDFIYGVQGDGAEGRLVVVNMRESHTRARIRELRMWLPQ